MTPILIFSVLAGCALGLFARVPVLALGSAAFASIAILPVWIGGEWAGWQLGLLWFASLSACQAGYVAAIFATQWRFVPGRRSARARHAS